MVSTLSSMKRTSGSTSGFQTSSSPPGFRNLIINGEMAVAQRGTSFVSPSNDYTLDRWHWSTGGAGAVTITRDTDVPNSTFKDSLKIDVTTADASIAAGDWYWIEQRIEGNSMSQLRLGTSDAQTFTISFWVKSPKTGTHTVGFVAGGSGNWGYPAEYTVNVADTWEQKSVTIVGTSSGTWLAAGRASIGAYVAFVLAAGSDRQATAETWAVSTPYPFSTSSQVNCMDNVANNFYITGVQLEVGSSATDFEHVPWDYQLSRCQRYYVTPHLYGTVPADGTYNSAIIGKPAAAGTIEPAANWYFPVTMRGTPTITTYNIGSGTTGQWSNASGTVSANIRVVMACGTMAVIDNTGVALSAGTQYYVNAKADAEL